MCVIVCVLHVCAFIHIPSPLTDTISHSRTPSQYGSAAKFPGSGGAVIGLCLDEDQKVGVAHAMEYCRIGFNFELHC